MIVQACLNGARDASSHPELPASVEQLVESAVSSVRAGANELHIHVRNHHGAESLHPLDVDDLIGELRNELRGTLIGISTGEWIENDDDRRFEYIASWRKIPDHASVNLEESGAIDVGLALHRRGIGIEAGLSTRDDAIRLVESPLAPLIMRVLVEPDGQDLDESMHIASDILGVMSRSAFRKPILLHGFDRTVWPFVDRAFRTGLSVRVGFEDTKYLPDGTEAESNAQLVAAAIDLKRSMLRNL
jgi:uncharacterized protein (DUF849 family)